MDNKVKINMSKTKPSPRLNIGNSYSTNECWLKWKTPQARWGKPEDLGDAAVYLASPASDFVTGQILYVDGGLLSTFGPSSC